MSALVLRRANVLRSSWSETEFDVFDGEREIGRIYQVIDHPDSPWFWSVSFQPIGPTRVEG
jgi:hypothetical protein